MIRRNRRNFEEKRDLKFVLICFMINLCTRNSVNFWIWTMTIVQLPWNNQDSYIIECKIIGILLHMNTYWDKKSLFLYINFRMATDLVKNVMSVHNKVAAYYELRRLAKATSGKLRSSSSENAIWCRKRKVNYQVWKRKGICIRWESVLKPPSFGSCALRLSYRFTCGVFPIFPIFHLLIFRLSIS